MNKILLLCGAKQSGKTSAANFIAAYTLNQAGVIGDFAQDTDGNIDVKVKYTDEKGNETISKDFATLNLRRTDDEFVRYAQQNIWSYIKLYSFADPLKVATSIMFNLDINKLYGTNTEKDEFTHITWKNFKKLFSKVKTLYMPSKQTYVTYRELLQYFGTNICRIIDDSCWINACFSNIKYEQVDLAIIDDGRFPNEVYRSKERNAKVIRFKRKIDDDKHDSEIALNDMSADVFDLDLDNTNMSLEEKNKSVFEAMKNWGWVKGSL